MEAGTEVDDSVCVCAHKVENLPGTVGGQGDRIHCHRLLVYRGDDGCTHLAEELIVFI